jgi:transglutaminase-like putative cysteine protease
MGTRDWFAPVAGGEAPGSARRSWAVATALRFALGLVLAVALASACLAGPSYQVPVGPRAIAMGGAFSSVADDISAIYWNPAGIPLVGHQEILGTHANLYGADITDNYFAFLLPLAPNHAVAVDWYHSGFDDSELDFGHNRFDLSYGWRLHPNLSAGINVKYLTQNTDLDGVNVRNDSGKGADVGMLVFFLKNLRWGLVAQDVFDTYVGGRDKSANPTFPMNVRTGISYDYKSLGTVAFDVDDRYHLGLEARPIKIASIRAGFEKDVEGSEGATYSAGFGLQYSIFRFDYAYVMPPVLDNTTHLGFSMAFNFNPSKIRIEKVEARDLYLSLHKSYARDSFGSVLVKNLDEKPITAKLSVLVPEMMEAPSEQEILVRPKASQEFPLTAVLPDKVMARMGDGPVEVRVSTTYQSQRLMRTEKTSTRCIAYGPGAIDWGQGAEQVAAFVTTRDPAVDALARAACGSVAQKQEYPLGNRNIGFASAIFDALSVLSVAYVPDPHNPYSSMAETAHAVDTVHYPRETLESRSGDCDDTSVLMAALLGNVGIATKIVDVPGHMFLMFDTGIHERNRSALGIDEKMYAVSDGGVWIPLETTAIGKGFPEAWRIGAESYASWASRGRADLVDVAASQLRYEPSEPPAAAGGAVSLDLARLGEATARDQGELAAWRDTYIAAHYGGLDQDLTASVGALNELAHVYFAAGRLEEARAKLEEALGRDPQSAAAHNNLAAVCVAEGDIDAALSHCSAALKGDPSDAGIWLNSGLIQYALGDTAAAGQSFAKGISLSGGYAQACKLLGLAPGEELAVGAREKMSDEEARLLLKSAFGRVPEAAAKQTETGAVAEKAPGAVTSGGEVPGKAAPGGEEAVPKPVPPSAATRTRAAGVRAGDQMALEGILYWKE